MSRRFLRAFGLLFILVLPCPGCFTALLWDWAGEQATTGQLVGVLADRDGDVIVYDLANGTVGVRIPPGWQDLPTSALATSERGDALALAEPLPSKSMETLPPMSSRRRLRQIGYKKTIGSQDVRFAGAERPYGFVQLMNERQQIVHELYGYDGRRRQWVRLATVELGEYKADAGKVATGVLLTPVVLAVDLAIVAAVVCAAREGGGSLSIHGFSGGGGCGTPTLVRFAERERYWYSLR